MIDMIVVGDNGPVTTQPATQPVEEVDEHDHIEHEVQVSGSHWVPFSPPMLTLYGTGLTVIGLIIVACIRSRKRGRRNQS